MWSGNLGRYRGLVFSVVCVQIFFNEVHIGGNDDLQALAAAGTLPTLLQQLMEKDVPVDSTAPMTVEEYLATRSGVVLQCVRLVCLPIPVPVWGVVGVC